MSSDSIKSVLSKYLPHTAVDTCAHWIVQKNIHLKITRGRASKYGDYRPLQPGKGHRITVNHNLNPFAFLITFVHEVAHLETFNNFKHYHEPHGKEWKSEFRNLMTDFIQSEIFPEDVKGALQKYILNPAASSCSDHDLLRALKKHDKISGDFVHLEDLPETSTFALHGSRSGMVFQKGHKIRSRFHCLEVNSKRVYLVSPLAEVKIIS